jgi:hypothetical protein
MDKQVSAQTCAYEHVEIVINVNNLKFILFTCNFF